MLKHEIKKGGGGKEKEQGENQGKSLWWAAGGKNWNILAVSFFGANNFNFFYIGSPPSFIFLVIKKTPKRASNGRTLSFFKTPRRDKKMSTKNDYQKVHQNGHKEGHPRRHIEEHQMANPPIFKHLKGLQEWPPKMTTKFFLLGCPSGVPSG